MSTAYGQRDNDNPFDASYEEYVRTVELNEPDQAEPFVSIRGDEDTDDADDPEVTQASAGETPGAGVEAPWSTLAETTEGDPFAAPEGARSDSSPERDQG